MSTYRVAVIGTGRMGGLIEDELAPNQFSSPYGHYPAYQHIDETAVVAVANRGEGRSLGCRWADNGRPRPRREPLRPS